MDYQLKGLILNHTLKSYTISPIESANVLKVTMRFYRVYKCKSPSKRRRDRLRKEKFLAKFRKDPVLVPATPFLELGQYPYPASLDGPVLATIETALITQAKDVKDKMRGLHHCWDCLAWEEERADEEWEQISNWFSDPLDQRADLRAGTRRMEQELRQLKEEKERLEASGLSTAGLVVVSSVSGESWGVSAETRATKTEKR